MTSVAEATASRDVPVAPPASPPPSNAFHLLLRRIHFYAGLLVGPFLLIAAVSGLLYALAPQAEKVLHDKEIHAVSTAQRVPLDHQVETARKVYPQLSVSGIIPGTGGNTTRVLFDDPSQSSPSYRPTAFVDPSTGQVRGKSVLYGSALAFPERAWLSELHRRLDLGEQVRIYSELAASWLAPITVAGLFLWWRQRRSRAMKSNSARGRLLRRHSVLGLVMALGFLFLSVTGLTWSTYAGENVANLRQTMSWTTPKVSTAPPGATSSGAGGGHADHVAGMDMGSAPPRSPATSDVSLLTVDAAAEQAGLRQPFEITPATKPGQSWVVKETRRSYSVGPDAIAVNPNNGVVTDRVPFSSFPLMAKLTDWGIRLHMGFLFGFANQLLLAVLAIGLAYIVIAGYRMWWKRRPTRNAGFLRLGRAPLRGSCAALFRTKPLSTTVGALAVLGVGWAVPLLGVSLVAFLGLDALLGVFARRAPSSNALSS